MILQCPSCYARFMVADALIPLEGRTVKCGKCAHQWFTARDTAAAAEPVPLAASAETPDFAALAQQAYSQTPSVEPPRLPALASRRISLLPFKIAVPVLATAWAVIALFAYFPSGQNLPVIGGIYGLFGATDTRGLAFADVTMQREELEGRTRFLLSGSIANHADAPRELPKVRVTLKDATNEVVWDKIYPVHAVVQPGELYPFRIENVETSFAQRAASIVLDIGNSFELGMR